MSGIALTFILGMRKRSTVTVDLMTTISSEVIPASKVKTCKIYQEECSMLDDPSTSSLPVWLGNPGSVLVIDIASGKPLLAPMANSPSQFFARDEQRRLVSVASGQALTAPADAPAPTLSTPDDDPAQRWTVGADGTLVSGTGLALAAPTGANEGTPAALAAQGASGPTVTWQLVSVPQPPQKTNPNEFVDLLPTDTFRITDVSTGKAVAILGDWPQPAALVDVADDPGQIWSYDRASQRLINANGRVLAPYLAGRNLLILGGFSSEYPPWMPDPDHTNSWVLTSGYIWNVATWETPILNGNVCLTTQGDHVGLANATPLTDAGQRWGINIIVPQSETTPTQLDTPANLHTLHVTVTTSPAMFADTLGDINVNVLATFGSGTRPVAAKIFHGVGIGRALQYSRNVPSDADIQNITYVEMWVERVQTLFWPWPVTDEWCVRSIQLDVDNTSRMTIPDLNVWVGDRRVYFTVPWSSWKLVANGRPVDWAMCSFAVGWPQYIIDCVPYVARSPRFPFLFLREMENFPWGRGYDPTKIDGIGILIGYVRGHLTGEQLKDKRCEVLAPGTYSYAYSKSTDAILYKFLTADGTVPSGYVRHSQLGSGQEVVMAGEFVVATAGAFRIDSIIAEVNNSSGHYAPDNYACLYHVQQKLESLGIPVMEIKWWTPPTPQ